MGVFLLAIAGCSTLPEWTATGESADFPAARYLSASGTGISPDEAKKHALADLAQGLESKVDYRYTGLARESKTTDSRSVTERIRVSSFETFYGVFFPQVVHQGATWYALAVIDKRDLVRQLSSRIASLRRRIDHQRGLGGISPLFRIRSIHKMLLLENRAILLEGELIALHARQPSTTTASRSEDELAYEILREKYLTFYVDIPHNPFLAGSVAHALIDGGFLQAPGLSSASFVVQGGSHSHSVNPPTDSPYFWYGYSAVLSFVDRSTGKTLSLRSGSGIVPGKSLAQAVILERNTLLQNVVSPFAADVHEKIFGIDRQNRTVPSSIP